MKNVYFLITLLILSFTSFAQTYFIYTADKSGNWDDATIWTKTPRTDQVQMNKVIIPENITITANDNVNNLGLGDVEILVMGRLKLSNKTTINLTIASTIQLSGTGQITANGTRQFIFIGSELKYDGDQDKTLQGPAYASMATGISPTGFLAGALPVNFVSFIVSKNFHTVTLYWSVTEQVNNDHYEVEKSINGADWRPIGSVMQSVDNKDIENYSFTDKEVSTSTAYYRIKQVDKDGRSQYSSVKFIKPAQSQNTVTVFAASKNRVTIRFDKDINKDITVRLLNIAGNVYKEQTFKKASTQLNLEVNTMPDGIYVVQMDDNTGWVETKKIIIQ